MKIEFLKRSSKFLDGCEESIDTQRGELPRGITVNLQPGGYNATVQITIDPEDQTHFHTDWKAKDPSRFPARIKVTATALHKLGFRGTFSISHRDGKVFVQKLP